jgi:hypothetical protein
MTKPRFNNFINEADIYPTNPKGVKRKQFTFFYHGYSGIFQIIQDMMKRSRTYNYKGAQVNIRTSTGQTITLWINKEGDALIDEFDKVVADKNGTYED